MTTLLEDKIKESEQLENQIDYLKSEKLRVDSEIKHIQNSQQGSLNLDQEQMARLKAQECGTGGCQE